MVLDFVLVGVVKGGIIGAGLATGISQLVGGLFPLIYFIRKNSSELRIIWAKADEVRSPGHRKILREGDLLLSSAIVVISRGI